MSTYVDVEISPDTTTRPVFTSVSQATRPEGSSRSTASRTPSEIWSAILSGWPSVTDSEVKRNSTDSSWVMRSRSLLDSRVRGQLRLGVPRLIRPKLIRQGSADRDSPFYHRGQLGPGHIGGQVTQPTIRIDDQFFGCESVQCLADA